MGSSGFDLQRHTYLLELRNIISAVSFRNMFIDRAEERPAERTVSCNSQVFACYEDDKYYYTLLESLHGGDLFDFFRVLTSDTLEPEVVENEATSAAGCAARSTVGCAAGSTVGHSAAGCTTVCTVVCSKARRFFGHSHTRLYLC